jgi:hypothetical protein
MESSQWENWNHLFCRKVLLSISRCRSKYKADLSVSVLSFISSSMGANKEATEPRVHFGKVEVITSKILRSSPWLGWPLWNICVTNDHGYGPLVVNTSWSFPHSRLITGFVTTQWPKERGQKDKQQSTKHTYKTKDRVTRTPLKTRRELRCSGRVSSSTLLFVLLYSFFWPLCCLFFFDIRILIAPLVSSNSSSYYFPGSL